MIGHVLLGLTPTQEDRVLTRKMLPLHGNPIPGGPCLFQTVQSGIEHFTGLECWPHYAGTHVGNHFDALCHRFGVARVNSAIRSRILSNRAARALAGVRELVETA